MRPLNGITSAIPGSPMLHHTIAMSEAAGFAAIGIDKLLDIERRTVER